MRAILAVVIVAAGICFVSGYSASATPANGSAIAGASQNTDIVTDVSGGCGRWRHRNRWGRCVHD
jgi:hypothetical protein